eukprot:CAMPEP_0172514168 /NCGR_PEP_ID=MMETSP1066-20121228/257814_1 /TAXON_ID=671091 /ORGANISM="Coscinodiscus wailesii, Strain CCMP2513" /LENGTH=421 /DNA_ID=CAMNT_0013294719 /DNA_START=82 /DNA_END=1344 /DNA_ORIENTATION=-
MQLARALSLLLSLVVSSHGRENDKKVVHQPHRISYDSLLDEEVFHKSGTSTAFVDALSEYGIISIKDIGGFSENKRQTLIHLHECAKYSAATKEHTFHDGTVRLTMATHTIPGGDGQQEIHHGALDSEACAEFTNASDKLRKNVHEAVGAFSERLGSILNVESPLLSTKDNAHDYDTFEDVVKNGEHLEHFHSYQRESIDSKSVDTIEMHTDQGVFIAFAPALMVDTTAVSETTEPKGDFYIGLKDGSTALVDLEENDLVIMLGDGFNQFINPKVEEGGVVLRATPHMLDMRSHSNDEARVWYGLMVLPPAEALHPDHEKTFGHMRELMIEASVSSDEDEVLALGCSGNGVARQLNSNQCDYSSLYCWHQCMPIDANKCLEKGQKAACVSTLDNSTVWVDNDFHDVNYHAICVNNTDTDIW